MLFWDPLELFCFLLLCGVPGTGKFASKNCLASGLEPPGERERLFMEESAGKNSAREANSRDD